MKQQQNDIGFVSDYLVLIRIMCCGEADKAAFQPWMHTERFSGQMGTDVG
jgi:hypothetical protein